MNFILKHKLTLIGIIAGAVAGYLYYHYVGCANGTCLITSKPFNSTVYGAIMGGLFLNIFDERKRGLKKEIKNSNDINQNL